MAIQPKASGLVLVRSPLLTSHKWRELVPSGGLVCRCHDVFLWSFVCFVSLRFRHVFVEAAALRSIVLRYAGAPITRVFFSFLGSCLFFSSIFCTISAFFMYGEYVVRSFLPNDVFLPCDHGLGFLHQLIDLLSIPQSRGKNVKTFRWDHRLQIQNLGI